jgi:hypothetical protein
MGMSETVEVRLARIEEMLRAHFGRIDERCGLRADTLADIERRVVCLEDWQSKTKGGWMVLSAVSAASAAFGGIVVKLAPYVLGGR